jgi:hypothetical protein
MGNVLHGFDEPLKQRLIQKACDAVHDGGAFIAIDSVIDDERRQNTVGLLMSLNMLIENGGGFDFSHQDLSRVIRTSLRQPSECAASTWASLCKRAVPRVATQTHKYSCLRADSATSKASHRWRRSALIAHRAKIQR